MSHQTSRTWRHVLTRAVALVGAPILLAGVLVLAPAQAASLNVNFTVSSATFGVVTLGTTASSTVTVTNTSSVDLHFKSDLVHGGDAGDFTASATACAGALAPAASCSIAVTFAPTFRGHRSTSLGVTFAAEDSHGNDVAAATIQSSLSGIGKAPGLTLSDASAGTITVGSSGIAIAQLTNTSSVNVTLTHWGLQGVVRHDFSIAAVTCPSPLGPSQSCDVVVVFKPATSGAVTTTLNVTAEIDGAPLAHPVIAQSTVSGTGVRTGGAAPVASLSSLNFGDVTVGTTASGSVALVNTSSGAITVSNIAIGGDYPHDFAITSTTCTGSIAAGASCSVDLTFSPSLGRLLNATIGARIDYTAGGHSRTTAVLGSLAGTGVKPTVSLTAPDFGSVALGGTVTGDVTVSNTSLAYLTLARATIVGPHSPSWTVSSTNCVGSITPGASCEIGLAFTPHSIGDLSTVLGTTFAIAVDAHSSRTITVSRGVTLAGAGTLPSFSVTAAPLGPTAQSTPVSESVTITNTSIVGLSYVDAQISGPNAAAFSATNATCTAQLLPTASCTLTLTFDPHANRAGAYTADLKVILTIDGISPATNVSLTTALSGTES